MPLVQVIHAPGLFLAVLLSKPEKKKTEERKRRRNNDGGRSPLTEELEGLVQITLLLPVRIYKIQV